MRTTASSPLLAVRGLSAVFKGGASALGHHWRLLDGDEHEVGRTKLYYDDLGGRTIGRLMRATGLSQRGDINAEVRDTTGDVAFRIFSTRRTPTGRLDLKTAEGQVIGSTQRVEGGGLVLLAPPSDTVVGHIAPEPEQDAAYRITDASGSRVAVLTTRRVEARSPSVAEWIFLPEVAGNQVAYQATIHAGFAGSQEYHLLADGEPPAAEPLRTLVTLAPLLAAYAY